MIKYFEVRSNERILRGMQHIADKSESSPVIIIHGFFSSNKIGPYRLYFEMAEMLSKNNYTTFRIDLSGMGESDGDIHDLLFETHVNDVCNVIHEVLKCTKSNSVHLIAHCFGCCVMLESCIKNYDMISSVTLLAPFIPSQENFCNMLNVKSFDQISNAKFLKYNGMIFNSSFIFAGYNLLNEKILSLAYQKNISAIFAGNDKFCPIENSTCWANQRLIKYNIVCNADHNFLDYEIRKKLFCFILSKLKNLKGV